MIKVQWRATQLETLRSESDVCWSSLSLGDGCGSMVIANTYSRSNLSFDELSVTVGSVVTRLTQLTSASNAHKVLAGDLNIDHVREGDVDRHKYLSRILTQANMVRVDLLPPLDAKPTCFPTQDRAFASSHIDVLALDESLVYGTGSVVASGIDPTPQRPRAYRDIRPSNIVSLDVDMDIGLGYLSQHKPVWVKVNIKCRVPPKPPPDIVFRRTKATPAQWKQAKALRRCASPCNRGCRRCANALFQIGAGHWTNSWMTLPAAYIGVTPNPLAQSKSTPTQPPRGRAASLTQFGESMLKRPPYTRRVKQAKPCHFT